MNNLRLLAITKDAGDTLHEYKKEFYVQKGILYMDGNSLGLASKKAENTLLAMIQAWKMYGIDGWMQGENPWYYFAEELGRLSAPLVGALPEEVIVTGSATVNLHQLIATFFKPEGKKKKILVDEFAFPTDVYAIKSQLQLRGLRPEKDLVVVRSKDRKTLSENDIIASFTNDVALVILPTVLYGSGQLLDIKRLTEEAHQRNILIGFDACHSVGVMPHAFHKDEVDFAVWCNYKYLNGGPGAEGGLFVHKKHLGTIPGLAGWFSSAKNVQFDMSHTLTAADDVGAYQMGTPHIFSMAPLRGSLELLSEIGIEKIRSKSLEMTDFMIGLIEQELKGLGFSLITPLDENRRGGHIALEHADAASICKALKAQGVIPDFRAPHIIRLAPSPLYTSFLDIYKVIEIIKGIMISKIYKSFTNMREVVA